MNARLHVRTFLFHCLALVLVVAYVNTFVLWREIGYAFGRGIRDGMPFIAVAALVLGVIIYVGVKARRGTLSIAWPWIAAAVMPSLSSCLARRLAPCFVRVKTRICFQLFEVIRCDSSSRLRSRSTG